MRKIYFIFLLFIFLLGFVAARNEQFMYPSNNNERTYINNLDHIKYSVSYGYDNLGQMTEVRSEDFTEQYDYDIYGNMDYMSQNGKSMTAIYDVLDRLVVFGDNNDMYYGSEYQNSEGIGAGYDYDYAGNRLFRNLYGYEGKDDILFYEYNDEKPNQLERIENHGTGNIYECSFDYDEVGRLVEKVCDYENGLNEIQSYHYNLNGQLMKLDTYKFLENSCIGSVVNETYFYYASGNRGVKVSDIIDRYVEIDAVENIIYTVRNFDNSRKSGFDIEESICKKKVTSTTTKYAYSDSAYSPIFDEVVVEGANLDEDFKTVKTKSIESINKEIESNIAFVKDKDCYNKFAEEYKFAIKEIETIKCDSRDEDKCIEEVNSINEKYSNVFNKNIEACGVIAKFDTLKESLIKSIKEEIEINSKLVKNQDCYNHFASEYSLVVEKIDSIKCDLKDEQKCIDEINFIASESSKMFNEDLKECGLIESSSEGSDDRLFLEKQSIMNDFIDRALGYRGEFKDVECFEKYFNNFETSLNSLIKDKCSEENERECIFIFEDKSYILYEEFVKSVRSTC
jgi:hypothetical protein